MFVCVEGVVECLWLELLQNRVCCISTRREDGNRRDIKRSPDDFENDDCDGAAGRILEKDQ